MRVENISGRLLYSSNWSVLAGAKLGLFCNTYFPFWPRLSLWVAVDASLTLPLCLSTHRNECPMESEHALWGSYWQRHICSYQIRAFLALIIDRLSTTAYIMFIITKATFPVLHLACACVRACVCLNMCVHACVHAWVHACVRACARMSVCSRRKVTWIQIDNYMQQPT